MSIEQAVIEKLRVLSPDKQQEVLDFVEFLEARMQHSRDSQAERTLNQAELTLYPLRGTVLHYEDPFEPAVSLGDWEALR